MIELKDMSLAQLESLKFDVEKLIKQHHDERKTQLILNLIDAARALKNEYPYISYDLEVCCPDCDVCFDIDVLENLVEATPRHFHS